jgi:hypothetical protein
MQILYMYIQELNLIISIDTVLLNNRTNTSPSNSLLSKSCHSTHFKLSSELSAAVGRGNLRCSPTSEGILTHGKIKP